MQQEKHDRKTTPNSAHDVVAPCVYNEKERTMDESDGRQLQQEQQKQQQRQRRRRQVRFQKEVEIRTDRCLLSRERLKQHPTIRKDLFYSKSELRAIKEEAEKIAKRPFRMFRKKAKNEEDDTRGLEALTVSGSSDLIFSQLQITQFVMSTQKAERERGAKPQEMAEGIARVAQHVTKDSVKKSIKAAKKDAKYVQKMIAEEEKKGQGKHVEKMMGSTTGNRQKAHRKTNLIHPFHQRRQR